MPTNRQSGSAKFPLGSPLPEFELPATDGKKSGSAELQKGKAALVIFTCNHCPYVKGSEAMLIEVVATFKARGLMTVAINSNDAVAYPDDSFEKMKEKSITLNLPYPYLFDEQQNVAKAFDAECTPELFLFDEKHILVYHGTLNDSPRDPTKVTQNYISAALEAVLAGEKPDPSFVNPLGCSIKWKATA